MGGSRTRLGSGGSRTRRERFLQRGRERPSPRASPPCCRADETAWATRAHATRLRLQTATLGEHRQLVLQLLHRHSGVGTILRRRGNAVGVLDGQHHPRLEQPCLTEHEASTGSAVCTSVGPRFNGAHVFGLGDFGGGFHLGLGDVGACSTYRESHGQRGSKGARGHGGRAGYGRGGGGRAGAAWAGPTCSAKVEAGEKASTICPSYLAFRCLDSCLCRTHTGGSSVDTGGESSSGESSGGEGTPDLPIDCAREPQRRKSPFELNRK